MFFTRKNKLIFTVILTLLFEPPNEKVKYYTKTNCIDGQLEYGITNVTATGRTHIWLDNCIVLM